MTQIEHVHGAAMSAAHYATRGAKPEMRSDTACAAAFARAANFGAEILVDGKLRRVVDPLPLVRNVVNAVRRGNGIATKVVYQNALHRTGRPFFITARQLQALVAWLAKGESNTPAAEYDANYAPKRRAIRGGVAASKAFRTQRDKQSAEAKDRRELQREANERTRAENAKWRAEDFAGRARL